MSIERKGDLRIVDVMEIFGCTRQTVYDMIKEGELEAYRLRYAFRIKRETVEALRNGVAKRSPQDAGSNKV